MKTFFLLLAGACIGLNFIENQEVKTIELGATCPMQDAKMKGVDGKTVTLHDLQKENGLLVVFSCNTCPFVIGDGNGSEGWDGRYNQVNTVATNAKVGMVLVNSNHAKRDKGDGFDDMVTRHSEKGFTMPYVVDEESALANSFGAKTTPHVFLFDKDMKLVYRGAIDDNVKSPASVKEKYVEDALKSLSQGARIKTPDTKAIGCSIKRVSKS